MSFLLSNLFTLVLTSVQSHVLIVTFVLIEEQTKWLEFNVLIRSSSTVELCKHSFWTYQFRSRLLWTPGKVVRLPLCNEKPSDRDKFPTLVFFLSHTCNMYIDKKYLHLLVIWKKLFCFTVAFLVPRKPWDCRLPGSGVKTHCLLHARWRRENDEGAFLEEG